MYQYYVEGQTAVYKDLQEQRQICIPVEDSLGMYEARNPTAITDEDAYAYAVAHPVNGQRLCEIAKEKHARTAAIIVSDATRNVPTKKVSEHLVNELVAGGVSPENITFFVALGVHRNATPAEMEDFIGSKLYQNIKIKNHDPYTPANLIDLGFSSRRTPVKLNKEAYECDVKIIVGKVELHEMAGYSGGRKSILPGVASEETILVNHRPEMIFDKGTGAGKTVGNPIHEDMLEIAQMFGVDFSVNFVVDNAGQPAGVFAGGLVEAHKAATDFLDQFCQVQLPEKPDIFVITPGQPLSIDLYQGVKALIAMQHVIDQSTVVVLYGDFKEGMNSTDFPLPLRKYQDLDEAKAFAWNNYQIQMDHTLPIIDILKQKVKVIVCTKNVPAEEIEAIRMVHCSELSDAMNLAKQMAGKASPKVMFCPHPQRAIIHY